MKKIILFVLITFMFISCTENSRVKRWGGTKVIELPKGYKFVDITWKDDNIWYTIKLMDSTDKVEEYKFKEDSKYGINEGTIVIKEQK